jgi:hypothetical protein
VMECRDDFLEIIKTVSEHRTVTFYFDLFLLLQSDFLK